MEYRERLTVPLWWWLVGLLVGVSSTTAVGFWVGPGVAVAAGVLTALLVTAVVLWWGRTEVAVLPTGLRVGPSLLEWAYAGPARAVDAEGARRLLGIDADPRAFVVQRTWLDEGVLVEVRDAADPHPYWFVSSRRPRHLADAIDRARSGGQS